MADSRRRMFGVPPGGMLYIGPEGSSASLSLWIYWLQIANRSADAAQQTHPSDAMIDALSARLVGHERELPDEPNRGRNDEVLNSMVAISASAHCLDGFYGAVVEQIKPPRSDAKRSRQILETLKRGFSIGVFAQAWQVELDWLFGIRDDIVHHGERLRPAVVSRTTAETVVFAGPEAYNLSALSARRSADLAMAVVSECIVRPKAMLEGWAERSRELMTKLVDKPPE